MIASPSLRAGLLRAVVVRLAVLALAVALSWAACELGSAMVGGAS